MSSIYPLFLIECQSGFMNSLSRLVASIGMNIMFCLMNAESASLIFDFKEGNVKSEILLLERNAHKYKDLMFGIDLVSI